MGDFYNGASVQNVKSGNKKCLIKVEYPMAVDRNELSSLGKKIDLK